MRELARNTAEARSSASMLRTTRCHERDSGRIATCASVCSRCVVKRCDSAGAPPRLASSLAHRYGTVSRDATVSCLLRGCSQRRGVLLGAMLSIGAGNFSSAGQSRHERTAGRPGSKFAGITLATRPHFLAACDGDLLVQRIVPDACGVEDSIAPGVNDERLPHVRRREGASEWEGNGDHVNEARATFTAAARDDVDSSTFLLLPTRIRRRPLARKNASQTIAYYTSGTVRNTPALPPASAQGEKPGGGGS